MKCQTPLVFIDIDTTTTITLLKIILLCVDISLQKVNAPLDAKELHC